MSKEIEALLATAIDLATKYKKLTGKPLGITGEVAEFYAAKLLNLKLMDARSPGYDAIDSDSRKIQIKGRCLPDKFKAGHRVGSIRLEHQWDSVILVLMDEFFVVAEMWEADRPVVEATLLAPGSKSRNVRGALSVSKFKQIGKRVWPV